jgi:hypothetical protein
LALFTLVVFRFVIFNIVALSKQVRQQKAAHSASTQHPTTEQHTESSSLFAFDFRLVHKLFRFHGFAPL